VTDWRTYATNLYCLPVDVRAMVRSITREHLSDLSLRHYIRQAMGLCDTYLFNPALYAETSIVADSAHHCIFIPPLAEGEENNIAGVSIPENQDFIGVIIDDSLIPFTETWKIRFTDNAGAFAISGTVSGSQTAGDKDSDYTASYLTIPADAWVGTWKKGDEVYINVYTYIRPIVSICTLLAKGLTLMNMADSGMAATKEVGERDYEKAMEILDRLSRPDDRGGLALSTLPAYDTTPRALPWDISPLGYNVTKVDWIDSAGEYGELDNVWCAFRESDY